MSKVVPNFAPTKRKFKVDPRIAHVAKKVLATGDSVIITHFVSDLASDKWAGIMEWEKSLVAYKSFMDSTNFMSYACRLTP